MSSTCCINRMQSYSFTPHGLPWLHLANMWLNNNNNNKNDINNNNNKTITTTTTTTTKTTKITTTTTSPLNNKRRHGALGRAAKSYIPAKPQGLLIMESKMLDRSVSSNYEAHYSSQSYSSFTNSALTALQRQSSRVAPAPVAPVATSLKEERAGKI